MAGGCTSVTGPASRNAGCIPRPVRAGRAHRRTAAVRSRQGGRTVAHGRPPPSRQTIARSHHGDGVPTTGWDRPEGQRAVLRLVGDLRAPAGRQPGRGLPGRGLRGGGEFLRQRRGLRRRASPSRSWARPSGRSDGPATRYVMSTKLFWGIHPRQHAQHPQPEVPDAGDRRLARAARPRLRGPRLLPSSGSRDPGRGDGVGHVGHGLGGQGPLLGHLGVVRRGSCARPGTSPTATTCTSRWSSSPSTTCCGGTGWRRSTPPSTTASGSASPPGARWPRACSPASTSTAFPRAHGPRCPATSGCATS